MDFEEGIEAFQDFYLRQGYSPTTLQVMVTYARILARYLKTQGVSSWAGFTAEHARNYQIELLDRPTKASVLRLRAVRRVGEFLVREAILFHDPREGLKKMTTELYSSVEPLTTEEVMAILGACDLESRLGIRDHALFSLMWEGCVTFLQATGVALDDLGADFRSLRIYGKAVVREVALSEAARESLVRYIEEVRGRLIRFQSDETIVFVTAFGKRFAMSKTSHMWPRLIGPYLKKARILKNVSVHAFKWARIKALLDQGLAEQEILALAGCRRTTLELFMRRIHR